MIRRIRFIAHRDKKILLIDLSNCSATEVEETFRALPDVVTTQARGSLDTLRLHGSIFRPGSDSGDERNCRL
jgi:hypothetical protein